MARIAFCHSFSSRNLRRSSGNDSSSHSVTLSLDSRVSGEDSSMALSRDLFGEEFLRAFGDNRPPVTRMEEVPYSDALYHSKQEASQAFLDNALRFHFCVAHHPFPMPLSGHDGVGFRFFVFVLVVMGIVPPFSAFAVSFLNYLNVCPAQLVPNVWVFLHGFEEVYNSLPRSFSHFLQYSWLGRSIRSHYRDGWCSFILASWRPPSPFSLVLVNFLISSAGSSFRFERGSAGCHYYLEHPATA
ncbi:putative transposase (putative), gypsy type [Senna tora]|uniref:Putative transposase (Putative), gypsy type n=1 Tax=Senna tora TaxID=362788 RepID=A0A834SGQ6_9FABA|nr:putative transposase (putative), gypsy type [Senna tora]